ncbi:unnamed protein product, partial [Cladocopium goreaui]
RKVSAKRWDELMIGKRFVNFNALQNLGDSNKPAVAIGVLYEKGFAKTSNTGSQYVHWSFTDFCTPQPRLLKLLLCSEAFEAWHVDLGKTVHYGAVFAMLNPTASNQRPDQGSETLISAKVTHSTQLVLLGQFPSLGFCSCHKKDGLPCSMPCDTEKTGGRLVCFYHTMHQEAQKIRNFAEMKKSQGTRGADVTPGLVVRPGPTPKAKGASKGTSSCQAGARVTMSWNQAMLAQAQGWGHMEIGRRPHHARPHLLGTRPPAETKREAKENKQHVQALHQQTSSHQISPSPLHSLDFPLLPRHHASTSAVGAGRTRDVLAEILDFWSSLQRDLKDVWRKHSWMQLTPEAAFAGELGRWGAANGKPHGVGCLTLAETQHLGSFREGRAEGVLREMEVQCQGGRFHPLRCARNLDVALLLLFQVARKFPKRKGTLRISQEAKRG